MKVVFTCGRMNPPTNGHLRLVNEVKNIAMSDDSEAMIFTTKTQDEVKNPLTPIEKKVFAEKAFDIRVNLTTSPFSALEELVENGANDLTFVVGEDRSKSFHGLVSYAEKLGVRLSIRTIARSECSESATAAREAAKAGDILKFRSLTPSPHEGYQSNLFRAVRCGMSGEE